MPAVSTDAMFSRRDNVVANDLSATETVMLDIEQGIYFGVRGVGRRIWDRLTSPVTLETLVVELTAEYDVDESTCRAEVAAFLGELREYGLIDVAVA
jgi:hypothetical protein